jgi:prepilin-type N-terminal cleavage/methylation domain-containing protein
MKPARAKTRMNGFTLLELLVAASAFLVVAGAAFALLGAVQKRYQTDSQVLSSFQEARLGMDQIVRDVNASGYPPQNQFSALPPANFYAATPVAWSPSYPGTPCTIGICITPGDFDLIIETDIDPQNPTPNGVEWVRYSLPAGSTTLMRGVVSKTATGDPVAATPASVMYPFVQNVMNNGSAAQIAAIQAAYPTMFPGSAPVPIFSYGCDTGSGTPVPCATAGTFNTPVNILDVQITLIVQASAADAQTGKIRLVELHGLGHRMNPNQ